MSRRRRRHRRNPELMVIGNPRRRRRLRRGRRRLRFRRAPKLYVRRLALNLPLTVRYKRRYMTFRGLVRRLGVMGAVKVFRSKQKYHGGKRVRFGRCRRYGRRPR